MTPPEPRGHPAPVQPRRGGRPRLRGAAGLPLPGPRLRLHRLQGSPPGPADRQADAGRLGIEGYVPYVDYLEVHPEEFAALFDTILINVTSFFRDPPAWAVIRRRRSCPGAAGGQAARGADPRLVGRLGHRPGGVQPGHHPGRGAGDGRLPGDRVKIYATNVNEDALARARLAQLQHPRAGEDVPEPKLRERYFEPALGGRERAFVKDLRRSVIFGRHDLIQDAPISRIDLLACRNTVMYFNTETQGPGSSTGSTTRWVKPGVLLPGQGRDADGPDNNTFVPVNLKRRIFAKVPREPTTCAIGSWGCPHGGGGEEAGRPTWSATSPAPRVRLRVRHGGAAGRQLQRPAGPGQPAGPVDVPDRAGRTSAGRSATWPSPTARPTSGLVPGPGLSGEAARDHAQRGRMGNAPARGGRLPRHPRHPPGQPRGRAAGGRRQGLPRRHGQQRRLQEELQTSHKELGASPTRSSSQPSRSWRP